MEEHKDHNHREALEPVEGVPRAAACKGQRRACQEEVWRWMRLLRLRELSILILEPHV